MSFRGNTKTLSLADIFQNLTTNAQSGALRLQRKGASETRGLLFEKGELRETSRGKEAGPRSFLNYLIGRCVIDAEGASAAAARAAEAGTTVLTALGELGSAPAEDLAALARRFTEEETYELFTWEDADFEFADGVPPAGLFPGDASAAGVHLSTGGLIMEAARRIDEWGRIRQSLPSGREILAAVKDPRTGAVAAPDDPVAARLLGLADGRRDIDDLVAGSFLSRFETGALLISLLEAKLLRTASVEELEASASDLARKRELVPLIKICERLIAMGRDTAEVRGRLAEAAVVAGDQEKAAIHLGVLADREMEAGRQDRAAELWLRILQLVPRSARAHQGLAEHYQSKGRKEESFKHYAALAKAHAGIGAADRAVAAARAAMELDAEDPRMRALLAEVLALVGRRGEAAVEYEAIADKYAAARDYRAAGDACRRALQADPSREEARRKLTSLLGADDQRRRGRRRIVTVLLVLLALTAVGGALAGNEFLGARPRVQAACLAAKEAEDKARAKGETDNFPEALILYEQARDGYAKVKDVWSFSGAAEPAGQGYRRCCDHISALLQKKREMETTVAARSAEIRLAADGLLAQGELDAALLQYQSLERFGLEADRTAARTRLREISAALEEIRAVARQNGKFASEDEEFEKVASLVSRWGRHPEVRALSFPVRVESEPRGAAVRLGEGPPATTPCTLRFAVSGPNQLTFTLKGYRDERRAFGIAELSGSRTVRMALSRVSDWTFRVGSPVRSPIVVAEGLAIFGDSDGNAWALSLREHKEVWKRPLGQFSAVTGAPAVDGRVVYLTSLDGKLHALDLLTGAPRWPAFAAEGLARAGPTVAEVQLLNKQKFVFFGTAEGWVYCVDAATGKQQWRSATKSGAVSAPVLVAAEAVYAGSDDEHLRALAPATGAELWKHKLSAAVRSPTVAAGDLLFVGAEDGCLYALGAARQEVLWRHQAKGAVRSGPVLAGGLLFFATAEGEVWTAEPREAAPAARLLHALGAEVSAAPCVTETRVYLGSHDGVFRALDRASGREVWRYKADAPVRSAAAFADGHVIFGSDDGTVYAFDER